MSAGLGLGTLGCERGDTGSQPIHSIRQVKPPGRSGSIIKGSRLRRRSRRGGAGPGPACVHDEESPNCAGHGGR